MNNREIDRLVAEKVMGWEIKVAMDGVTEFYDNGSFCEGRWVEDVGPLDKDNLDVFKPSTKIQDAWLVVEKLRDKEMATDIFVYKHKYNADITKFKSLITIGEAESETAPMAICLAALKVVGVEVQS